MIKKHEFEVTEQKEKNNFIIDQQEGSIEKEVNDGSVGTAIVYTDCLCPR